MIWTINYRGLVVNDLSNLHLQFRNSPPQMSVSTWIVKENSQAIKLILFKNKKCRLMGCDEQICNENVVLIDPEDKNRKLHVKLLNLMSATATVKVEGKINLIKLAKFCYDTQTKFFYEAELFPALRLKTFNPLCVNVFGTGKCVILGIRNLSSCSQIVDNVIKFINSSDSVYETSQQQ